MSAVQEISHDKIVCFLAVARLLIPLNFFRWVDIGSFRDELVF